MKATLHFDGSALPTNPGHVMGGAVLELETGHKENLSLYIGEGSCNSGEYAGLILGIRKAIELNVTHLQIYGDSELIIKQVSGVWGSKKAHLTVSRDWVRSLLDNFEDWTISWVPREQNKEADALTGPAYLPPHIRNSLYTARQKATSYSKVKKPCPRE